MRRSPQGERGLKFRGPSVVEDCYESLSARRAWIEIHITSPARHNSIVALRKESVD